MKPNELEKRIVALIDKHSSHATAGRHGPKRESGTLDTLAKRLGVPDSAHVQSLIESGRLVSLGAVNRNDPNGTQSYASDHLNEIRREVVTAIAEQVIDAMPDDAEPESVAAAVSHALATYQKSLSTPAVKEFAARSDEERPGVLRRVATGAAVAGGLYAGASYLRGRKIGAKGILPALKAGNAANVADLRNVGGKISALLRPRVKFSANLTPARARSLLARLGNELRRIERA